MPTGLFALRYKKTDVVVGVREWFDRRGRSRFGVPRSYVTEGKADAAESVRQRWVVMSSSAREDLAPGQVTVGLRMWTSTENQERFCTPLRNRQLAKGSCSTIGMSFANNLP